MYQQKLADRKPDWLKIRISNTPQMLEVAELLKSLKLHSVCEEADCPNLMECFGNRTATFMILGKVCTRNCGFCNVSKGIPEQVDFEEPRNVAEAVKELGLIYVVVTSVTRDDLSDGGASHFARVIDEIQKASNTVSTEVLIPDFRGDKEALWRVVKAKPKVINHNVETIQRLYPSVRPMAQYTRSLELIKRIKDMDSAIYSKSGFMVGLGETQQEVEELLQDLRKVDCDIVTIGQYLAPSKRHHPVVEYIHPDVFAKYKQLAEKMDFKYVASGPFVRSSYHAGEAFSCQD